jgi:hypothetical protein
MAKLTLREIYNVARAAGFSPEQAVTFAAIAKAESGGNPNAHNPRGEDSRGLWQINVRADQARATKWGNLYDPLSNARAAYAISNQGRDMRPWTTTHDRNKGTAADYRTYLDEIEAEVRVRGDHRGVHGYGSPLPSPLPASEYGPPPGDSAGEPAGGRTSTDSNQPSDVLTDYFEQLAGIQDLDADGLSDRREVMMGTNPLLKDSDTDGMQDAMEIALGMNPARNDTDFDGILDMDEVRSGSDPLGTVGPAVPDMHVWTAKPATPEPPRMHSAMPIANDPQLSFENDQQLSIANDQQPSGTSPASHMKQRMSDLDRVTFGGKTVDRRTADMLKEAQRIANAQDSSIGMFDLTQGSWSHAGASAGTHEGPGAFDIYTAPYTEQQKKVIGLALRTVGFASWRRRASDGNWEEHWHGIAIGSKGLPQIAQNQVTSYLNGHNGLKGNGLDRDPRPESIVTWEQYQEQHATESFDPYGQANADPNPGDNGDDALTRYFEQLTGIAGPDTDTDTDGLPDWQEVAVSHTDPTSGDSDKDRVTDAMELSLGMDPLSKDTDRDGRADGNEIRHGSDPLKPGSAFDEGSLAAEQDVDSGYDHHSADAVDLN